VTPQLLQLLLKKALQHQNWLCERQGESPTLATPAEEGLAAPKLVVRETGWILYISSLSLCQVSPLELLKEWVCLGRKSSDGREKQRDAMRYMSYLLWELRCWETWRASHRTINIKRCGFVLLILLALPTKARILCSDSL
jgi:hypothetical protein